METLALRLLMQEAVALEVLETLLVKQRLVQQILVVAEVAMVVIAPR